MRFSLMTSSEGFIGFGLGDWWEAPAVVLGTPTDSSRLSAGPGTIHPHWFSVDGQFQTCYKSRNFRWSWRCGQIAIPINQLHNFFAQAELVRSVFSRT